MCIRDRYNLVGLPFLWTSLDAAHEAMDGDFGQALDKKLEEQAGITLSLIHI